MSSSTDVKLPLLRFLLWFSAMLALGLGLAVLSPTPDVDNPVVIQAPPTVK